MLPQKKRTGYACGEAGALPVEDGFCGLRFFRGLANALLWSAGLIAAVLLIRSAVVSGDRVRVLEREISEAEFRAADYEYALGECQASKAGSLSYSGYSGYRVQPKRLK